MSRPEGERLTRRQVAAGVAAITLVPLAPGSRRCRRRPDFNGAREDHRRRRSPMGGLTEISPCGEWLSVPLTVSVDSPMTADDHVKAIHILSEKNPVAEVVKFNLSPRMGRAKVSTSIRMADTQRVLAVAEMSDGSFWSDEAHVIVTLSACIDGG